MILSVAGEVTLGRSGSTPLPLLENYEQNGAMWDHSEDYVTIDVLPIVIYISYSMTKNYKSRMD